MESIKQILDSWAIEREKVLIDNYKSKGLKASGNFEKSIIHITSETSLEIKSAKYVGALVLGRKQTGSGNGNGTLKSLIRKWIDDKGITPTGNISKDTLAFLITRKIHRDGITVPNQYNDGRLLMDTFTKESVGALLNKISKNYITKISSDIQETWQQ